MPKSRVRKKPVYTPPPTSPTTTPTGGGTPTTTPTGGGLGGLSSQTPVTSP